MAIELKNVSKNFYSESGIAVKALQNIDFSLKDNSSVSVIGPSGAGKSTLLHILGLMDSQNSGEIFFDGKLIEQQNEDMRSELRRRKIGFVFQMHYLLPEFNILENMLLPVWNQRREKRSAALDILNDLGLSERATHLPGELSGGEQQRAALARALINNPQLLLCDEPTGNLDRNTAELVEKTLIDESRRRGISLVIVTHNAELARKTDHIIEMVDGKILTNSVAED